MIEQALAISSTSLNGLSSGEYLKALVKNLALIIGADYCFVGELSNDKEFAKTTAFFANGKHEDEFTYKLEDSPCHDVYDDSICCVPSEAPRHYPNDQFLVDMSIEAYFGVPLHDRNNNTIGILAAMFTRPIANAEEIKQVFHVFNLRTSAELDRSNREATISKKMAELEEQNLRLKVANKVYDVATDGIIISDSRHRTTYVNAAFEEMSGYSKEEQVGKTSFFLFSGLNDRDLYKTVWAALEDHGSWKGELRSRKKNDKTYPIGCSISVIPGANDQPNNYVTIVRDLSQEMKAKKLISYQATHDQLTGLLNRYEFNGQVDHLLAMQKRQKINAAFILIDLDNFKEINDSQGHIVGDSALKESSKRLSQALREGDILARLGGDEFAIFASLQDPKESSAIASRILSLFDQPFYLDNDLVTNIYASIGVSVFPDDADNSKDLFRHADQALYEVKASGRHNYFFSSRDLRDKAIRQHEVKVRLQDCLDNNRITPYFQPIVDIHTGEVTHCEALARWHDPEFGDVPPDEFIGIAESHGMIKRLGETFSTRAVEKISLLNKLLGTEIGVSINRSPQEFIDTGDEPLLKISEKI